jgi:hypothetical protein
MPGSSSIGGTSPDDGYRLSEIIAKADCTNHAILIEAEFTRAVPRLLAAGLIGRMSKPVDTGSPRPAGRCTNSE